LLNISGPEASSRAKGRETEREKKGKTDSCLSLYNYAITR